LGQVNPHSNTAFFLANIQSVNVSKSRTNATEKNIPFYTIIYASIAASRWNRWVEILISAGEITNSRPYRPVRRYSKPENLPASGISPHRFGPIAGISRKNQFPVSPVIFQYVVLEGYLCNEGERISEGMQIAETPRHARIHLLCQ
jgi:hypothetical protein